MSFDNFIQKPISKKVVVFEIAKGKPLKDSRWLKYSPTVWMSTLSWIEEFKIDTTAWGVGRYGTGTWGTTSTGELPAPPQSLISQVAALEVNQVQYIEVETIDLCDSTSNSFIFDVETQVLYVNHDGYLPSGDNVVILSIVLGFATDNKIFNQTQYRDKILSIPAVAIARDNLFNSIVKFSGGDVTLINTDGYFDDFGENDIYGQKITLRLGGDDLDFDEYEVIYTGYLEDYRITDNDAVITIKDERKNISKSIPINTYSLDDYPYMKDANEGLSIPNGYGYVLKSPTICTNETQTASTYDFKFIDTTNHNIYSIEIVQVDGKTVTPTATSLTDGTFTLSSTDYTPEENNVTVTYNGYVDDAGDMIENPLEIIEDLLTLYNATPYTSVYYDLVSWEATKAGLPDITFCLTNSFTLIDSIGKITSSILGSFVVNKLGLFDVKIVDLDKVSTYNVPKTSMIGNRVKDNNDSVNYISSAKIGYSRYYNEDTLYQYYINTEEEADLTQRYRSYVQGEFLTLLRNKTDAIAFGEKIMALFGGIFHSYTFTTKFSELIDVQIEDVITVDISRREATEKYIDAIVTSKSVDYSKNEITIICRRLS